MSGPDPAPDPDLAIRIQIAEPALAVRLAALFGQVPGLRIAAPGEPGDLVLSVPDIADGGFEQPLTPRERDVIALLAEGLSNKEIGCRLGISPDTAKFHVGRVIDKLDATGRTDAVAHAARRGIIHL
jgi:DNA-binding CsgD family transcriptional regulator